jgi:hypothetical protein
MPELPDLAPTPAPKPAAKAVQRPKSQVATSLPKAKPAAHFESQPKTHAVSKPAPTKPASKPAAVRAGSATAPVLSAILEALREQKPEPSRSKAPSHSEEEE